MKELSIEEKARAYDEALKLARDYHEDKNCFKYLKSVLENIFPEIKESEDEKMIGRIIKALQRYMPTDELLEEQEIVAWLEKQGEHKAANKVEPKFKVGDWITIDNPCQIISVNNENYIVQYCDDEKTHMLSKRFCDSYFHLWTIQDAKDGDVLVGSDDSLFIFAKVKDNSAYYHFSLCKNGSKEISDGNHSWETANSCHPATKEQRELLFAKMKEAGYEWDAEKKELKKINNALEECEIEHIEHGKYYYCIKDYYSGGCKRASKGEVVQALRGMSMMALGVKANEYFIPVKRIVDVSPAWSEEDEKRLQSCIRFLQGKGLMGGVDTINSKWLKSLKPQPKQEWNEEDEQYLAICKNALHQYQTVNQWDEVTVIRWLEGKLKQRMEE